MKSLSLKYLGHKPHIGLGGSKKPFFLRLHDVVGITTFIWVFFFKGGLWANFSRIGISSHIRVQMGRELVRLIDLIELNMFSIHIGHWKSSENFSWPWLGRSALKKPLKMAFFGLL